MVNKFHSSLSLFQSFGPFLVPGSGVSGYCNGISQEKTENGAREKDTELCLGCAKLLFLEHTPLESHRERGIISCESPLSLSPHSYQSNEERKRDFENSAGGCLSPRLKPHSEDDSRLLEMGLWQTASALIHPWTKWHQQHVSASFCSGISDGAPFRRGWCRWVKAAFQNYLRT